MTQATTTYQAGQQITFEQKYAEGTYKHEGIIETAYGDNETLAVKVFAEAIDPNGKPCTGPAGMMLIDVAQVTSIARGIETWQHSEGLVTFAC